MAINPDWYPRYRPPETSITRIGCGVLDCRSYIMALTADLDLMLGWNGWRLARLADSDGADLWLCPLHSGRIGA